MFSKKQRVSLTAFPNVHGTVSEVTGSNVQVQWDGGVQVWYMNAPQELSITPFARNSVVIDPQGKRRRVIDEIGDIRFLSAALDNGSANQKGVMIEQMIVSDLMRANGYQEEQPLPGSTVDGVQAVPVPAAAPSWPQNGDRYFHIQSDNTVAWDRWTDSQVDRARRDTFGIRKTEEACMELLRSVVSAWEDLGD